MLPKQADHSAITIIVQPAINPKWQKNASTLVDLEEGLQGLQPPYQISKIKESNKTKQKIEDNPLAKEEERKSCMFV